MKIFVTACAVKKKTDEYTIYELSTAEHGNLDSFTECLPGEHEGEITPNQNPQYNSRFKPGAKKFPGKNYDFEARRVALECAVSLICADKYKPEMLTGIRDKFYEYLKNGN